MIGKAKHITAKFADGDKSKIAFYVNLIIFKKKIELAYSLIKYLIVAFQNCRNKKDDEKEIEKNEKN